MSSRLKVWNLAKLQLMKYYLHLYILRQIDAYCKPSCMNVGFSFHTSKNKFLKIFQELPKNPIFLR